MDSTTQFFVSLGVTAAIGIVGIYYQHRQLQAVTPAVAAAQRKGR